MKAARNAAYLQLASGELDSRALKLREMMQSCFLCPRRCRCRRSEGELGKCRTGPGAVVSSYGPHFGEERPLVGEGGSGTIFFTGCNLLCAFCQNDDISHLGRGDRIDPARLASIMMLLQERGCHNINLVTPTHQVPAIVEALARAVPLGLAVPIVYNCGGYESVNTLRLFDGIVDIYMPDMKYGDNSVGLRLSGVPDYWDRSREAIREMHRQVGDLQITEAPDAQAIATRGLLVRHLILPNGLAGTENVASFLATEISTGTYVNLMDQYRPCFHADRHPEIGRAITAGEYSGAIRIARAAGLWRFDS
jgi:putative pyruvate formate lyase activating enzyme